MQIVTNPEIVKALIMLQSSQMMTESTKEYLATVEDLTEKECQHVMICLLAFATAIENNAHAKIADVSGFQNWRAQEVSPGVYELEETKQQAIEQQGTEPADDVPV
jgi:hypothetical protein